MTSQTKVSIEREYKKENSEVKIKDGKVLTKGKKYNILKKIRLGGVVVMTYEVVKKRKDIVDRIKSGYYEVILESIRYSYTEQHVFDEFKSVRWNREEARRQNIEIKERKTNYREKQKNAMLMYEKDIKEYIKENYTQNECVVGQIYTRAYREGHSGGLGEVLNMVDEYSDFALEIIGAIEN